ncbi:interleukin 4 receptor, tandem duplicate 1 [Syngnathoides biaculeatus]|uniref:interleukin 4 receptor, tandem duplicate 1 n=1 Tax=Syngnathoides biaculeatus TaxID=300417 RepID=UPI002ADDFAFD|nr:interleukin 4 receptor, tandem duplicate 1 [Syngnathoides biaculeatus]
MFFILLVVGHVAASVALSGVNLDCTNDNEGLMSCFFDAPNCTDYNVTLWSLDGYGESSCLAVQCASGKCCCSVSMILVFGENHTAFVRRAGEYVESKNISVKHSFKPQTPTMVSVNETNGNFRVFWRTNHKGVIGNNIITHLTYRQKGDSKEVTKVLKAPLVETPQCDLCATTEILGAHLKPSTTYVVRVQSLMSWESPPSEPSKEYEFITPASRERLLMINIISLSLVAITISIVAYVSYVKCRAKYWDSVSDYQNSKLLDINPSEEEVLKPTPPVISSIYVESLNPDDLKRWSKGSLIDSSTESLLQSSGISSDLPSLSYACTEASDVIAGVQEALNKALMNIIPISTDHLLKDSNKPTSVLSTQPSPSSSEQHSALENTVKYSFIRPTCPTQVMNDNLEGHAQPEMPCNCSYQETGGMSTADQRGSACEENMFPTLVASYTLSGTSSRQCNRDSGRFSDGENADASFSCSNTGLSGNAESRVAAEHEHCQEMSRGACSKWEDATKEAEGHTCIPASFLVDDNYQSFQVLSELSGHQYKEQKSGGKKVLENSLEDAAQGKNCIPVSSNHSFAINDNHQEFRDFGDLSDCHFEEKSVKKRDPDKVLEMSAKDATKGNNGIPASSNHSFPSDDNYQAFRGFRDLSQCQFEEQKSVKKQEPDKVLEISAKDATKGNNDIPASSNFSFPIDDNYQAFQGFGDLSQNQFGEQKSVKKQKLDKVSEISAKDATKDNNSTPASSNNSFPIDDSYQAFQGFRDLSQNQFGEQKSVKKQEPDKVLEISAKDATKGNNDIPASSKCCLLMVDGYEVFQGLKELSDDTFGSVKSVKKQGLDKGLEKSFDDFTEGDICMPSRSNYNCPVDDNHKAFQDLREHSENPFGEQIGDNKEDLEKVLENYLEDVTQDDNHVHARSDRCLTVAVGKETFPGLRELSGSQFGQQNGGKTEDLRGTSENSFEDVCKGYSSNLASSNPSVPVDNKYQTFQGLWDNSDNQFGKQKSGEKENLEEDVKNPINGATKADGSTCVLGSLLNALPVDDNYQRIPCLKKEMGMKLANQRSGVKEESENV